MLDDFSAVKLNKKPDDPSSSTPTAAPVNPDSLPKPAAAPLSGVEPSADDSFSEEDFAKQLQAGMAELLGDLDKNVRIIRFTLAYDCTKC